MYKWQGKIYAVAEDNKVFILSDNGDTWSEYCGISDVMQLGSLVDIIMWVTAWLGYDVIIFSLRPGITKITQ